MCRFGLDGLTSEKVGAIAGCGSVSEDEDWERKRIEEDMKR